MAFAVFFNVPQRLLSLPVKKWLWVFPFQHKGNGYRDLRHRSSSFTFIFDIVFSVYPTLTGHARLDELSISVEDLFTLYINGINVRPLQLLSACCRKTYILAALISSRLCYVLAAPCSSAYPSATGCAPCPAYAGITGSCHYHSAHHFRFMAFV